MKEYLEVLKAINLFKDINQNKLENMLNCFEAQVKSLNKNEVILLTGEVPQYVGIVISGKLHIIREDYEGNTSLVANATPGEMFSEALCYAGVDESPVTVLSGESSTVMLIKFDRILNMCDNSCVSHQKFIENMLNLVSKKNLFLQSRIDIITLKSIRKKVLHYLESFVHEQGHNIIVPFNREEMANYLCVERSALSHELSRMKKDGLINYNKNKFILL